MSKKTNCKTVGAKTEQTNSGQGGKKVNRTWIACQKMKGAITILDPSIFEFDAVSPRY